MHPLTLSRDVMYNQRGGYQKIRSGLPENPRGYPQIDRVTHKIPQMTT